MIIYINYIIDIKNNNSSSMMSIDTNAFAYASGVEGWMLSNKKIGFLLKKRRQILANWLNTVVSLTIEILEKV